MSDTTNYCELCERTGQQLATAEAKLKEIGEWLDNNTTHYEPDGHNQPALASVSKKIWYHGTNDIESYPFTDMMNKSMLNRESSVED